MRIFGFEIRRAGKAPPVGRYVDERPYFSFSPRMSVSELLSNATVSSCVGIIADAIAALPLNIYRDTETGREKFTKSAMFPLLNGRPNPDEFHSAFINKVMAHLLLRGNAFVFLGRGSGYDPAIRALYALNPDSVSIKRDDGGHVYYTYTVDGTAYKYTQEQVLHISAGGWDGLRGYSPIEYASHAAATGLKLEQYTSDYFDNGIHSKFAVTTPSDYKNWKEDDTKRLQNRFAELYGGRENAQKPLVLNHGMTLTALNASGNGEAQLVENRTFSEKEIAKIFRVPLFMLGNADAKFNNMELMNSSFIQHTLTPWLVRLQEAFGSILPLAEREAGAYVEFETNAMLRADATARWVSYRNAFNIGALTLDEIRRKENLPELPDGVGKMPFVPVNLMPLTKENLDAYMAQQKQTLKQGEGDGKQK